MKNLIIDLGKEIENVNALINLRDNEIEELESQIAELKKNRG